MPVELLARLPSEAATKAGKVECTHLPGPFNRFCSSCDALIVAHGLATCRHGHAQMVLPSTTGAVGLWCAGCDTFEEFAA